MSLDETKTYRMQEATKLIARCLPLDKWGFRQSAKYFDNNTHPTLIYDSESCRLKILYEALGRYEDHTMLIHYGRLDVPDHASIIVYMSSPSDYHLLWHNVFYAIDFLDGLSPQEAKIQKPVRLVREFEQSDMSKEIKYDPEKILVFHRWIWESYGKRLFNLFDARQAGLWEGYSAFVREYWKTLARP
jgi:hypothetical protein